MTLPSTSLHGLSDRAWNDLIDFFPLSYTMPHVAEHCSGGVPLIAAI
jgi:hypothetical protein